MTGRRPARGFVLIMVLVVIMLASMVAASLLFVLKAEQTASAAGANGDQAWAAVMSGVYHAMRVAADATPGSFDWQDNPVLFRDQLVCDDGARKWYFSVFSASDMGGLRFGLTDEAGKINLYNATSAMLEALPNMTPTLAQSLLSAVADNAPRLGTNLDSAVSSLTSNPATDRRLSRLEELLYFGGVTPRLLFGSPTNQMARLDSGADDTPTNSVSAPDENSPKPGLCNFLTLSSYDLNQDNEGRPRLNLNQGGTDLSSLELPQSAIDYLDAVRTNKQRLAHPAELLEASGKFKNERGTEVTLNSEIGKAQLPLLLDRCTATNQDRLAGLVNLNTAPAGVLAALPGMTETMAEAVVSARAGLGADARTTPAWLYQEGVVNADIFKKIAPYLTTRSRQYRFQVAAYASPEGAYRVVEAVVDTAVKPPTILSLRDLTRQGLPFNFSAPPDSVGATNALSRIEATKYSMNLKRGAL